MATSPVQIGNITKKDLEDPNLGKLNDFLNQLRNEQLRLGGFLGPISIQNHFDMQGNAIINVGTPANDSDTVNAAVSKSQADSTYGAPVVQQAIEVIGTSMPQTYRRLSDVTQSEQNSTYLNKILSTPPTSNASNVTFTVIDGTHTQINISASIGSRADNSGTTYAQRQDTVVNPASFAIDTVLNSGAVRTSSVVTLKFTVPQSFVTGNLVQVAGVTDTSFNGLFAVASVPDSTHITYYNPGPDATSGAGTGSLGGVYYYYLAADSKTLSLIGPFAADNPTNRLQANMDGRQFIAVAVVTASGGNPGASGGGGDPGLLGCVLVGTPIELHTGDRETSRDTVRCSAWVKLTTASGKEIHVARGTLVSCWIEAENLFIGTKVRVGHVGEWEELIAAMQYVKEQYKEIRRVEPSHTYLAGGEDGIELHNQKTA